MDPATLGLAAATLLATKAGEGFASQVGADAWEAVRRLYGFVRRRLSGDAAEALLQLERSEGDSVAVSTVATAVQNLAVQDLNFRTQLQGLILEASRDPNVAIVVAEARDNAKQLNFGGDNTGTINM